MYHILINPASRSGFGKKLWFQSVQPALKDKNIPYKAYFSQKPGDVAVLAKKITADYAPCSHLRNKELAFEDACKLIILGGDGTVNEALQGIPSGTRVIIGYIPTGSSNDLARDLGISKEPVKALETILAAETCPAKIHRMDRGIVKSGSTIRSFSVSNGIGFDAAVCKEAMHSQIKDTLNQLKLGKLTYLGIALKQLFTAKSVSCDLYLDHRKPIHIKGFLFAASMIHCYEGGGFQFCPNADYGDGIFDMCVVGHVPKLLILFALPTAFKGKHFMFRGVNHYRAKHIRIRTNLPLAIHTDGEYLEMTDSIEITCLSKDICFIA